MKGYFSLNKYETEHSIYVIFGNLLGLYHPDPEQLCICVDRVTEEAGLLIAHDVVEHKSSHRTERSISAEEELQALGAMCFVRPNQDILYDVYASARVFEYREAKQPPRIIKNSQSGITLDMVEQSCLDNDVELSKQDLEITLNHINYGYWQKSNYYRGNQNQAHNDFIFIQDNVVQALKECMAYWEYSGVTFYFDTVKGIFRHQFKKQPKKWSFKTC